MPVADPFITHQVGCVSDEAVVDAGSGLFSSSVSMQLHLKGALKLEVMAHLLQAYLAKHC